jgi:hypothetical protein
MEFQRYFPATIWLWRRRVSIAWTVIASLVFSYACYKSVEVAYYSRANNILALITNVHSDTEMNAAIAKLNDNCRPSRTVLVGDDVAVIRTCSEGNFFYPYQSILTADSVNRATGQRSLSTEIAVPRSNYIPMRLEVERLLSVPGEALSVERRPNTDSPKGVVLRGEAHSKFKVRVNYKCAIPFARCVSEKELISITDN